MLLGLLSDTHDQVERTAGAAALLAAEGAEVLIHLGDLTGPAVVRAVAGAGLPCHYVWGNNDYRPGGLGADDRRDRRVGPRPRRGVLELDGRRIAATHGHLTGEFRRLLLERPDYLLFGHTHQPLDERDGPTRQVNPGALHRARRWTVAVLDLGRDEVRFHAVR